MLKNYFLIAVRYLTKYKTYSFINILGLSIALVPVILTILFVGYEFSYDKFNKNCERIYRVTQTMEHPTSLINFQTSATPMMPSPLAQAMKDAFPEVQYAVRISKQEDIVYKGDDKFEEDNIFYADPDILKMFSFKIISGDANTALSDPFSVALSESMARKYFGNSDPLNKTIRTKRNYDLTVKVVYQDLPENSHFRPDFIIPISRIVGQRSVMFQGASDWGFSRFYTYFMLKKMHPLRL